MKEPGLRVDQLVYLLLVCCLREGDTGEKEYL